MRLVSLHRLDFIQYAGILVLSESTQVDANSVIFGDPDATAFNRAVNRIEPPIESVDGFTILELDCLELVVHSDLEVMIVLISE